MNESPQDHPCAYHYRVEPPDYWCEVCQAFKPPTVVPKPPLAVRLARFVHPELAPANIQTEDGFPQIAVWSEEIIHGEQGDGITLNVVFRIDSLDDLALAEQRVVEVRLGQEYIYYLTDVVLAGRRMWENEPERRLAVATATAAQRAAALEAVLAAHPELETKHE